MRALHKTVALEFATRHFDKPQSVFCVNINSLFTETKNEAEHDKRGGPCGETRRGLLCWVLDLCRILTQHPNRTAKAVFELRSRSCGRNRNMSLIFERLGGDFSQT